MKDCSRFGFGFGFFLQYDLHESRRDFYLSYIVNQQLINKQERGKQCRNHVIW